MFSCCKLSLCSECFYFDYGQPSRAFSDSKPGLESDKNAKFSAKTEKWKKKLVNFERLEYQLSKECDFTEFHAV